MDGGLSDCIGHATDWSLSPVVLAWLSAALLRVALGSATVAVVTHGRGPAAAAGSGVHHPEIMVLAISCGSIAFSHVNDPGFWRRKEYFNLSVIDAIKARTAYSTVLSVLGPGGVLAMESILARRRLPRATTQFAEPLVFGVRTRGARRPHGDVGRKTSTRRRSWS